MASKAAELLLRIKTVGEEALDKVASSFDTIKEVGMAAFAAISAVIVKSVADYRQQEEAINSLSRTMVNNGVYSTELKNQYLEQASALQQLSLFGDEQIVAAQGILQSYLGQTKVSKELTQATLDLATAKKMDLASAAEMVGKSIGTNTNALARNGIEVNQNASQQEKLSAILGQLNDRWGGQAQAATEGLGSMTMLTNALSDVFELVGERLAPVITFFANKLRALATDTVFVNQLIDAFVENLRFVVKAGVLVAGVFEGLGKVIGTTLAGALGTVSDLMSGQFKSALEKAKLTIVENGSVLVDAYDNTAKRMAVVDAAFLAGKEENLKKEEQLVLESNSRKSEIRAQFQADEASKEMEALLAQQQLDLQLLEASEENRARVQLQQRIKAQEAIIKATADGRKKLAAQEELYDLNEQQRRMIQDQKYVEDRKSTLATIATLAQNSNKNLAAIGKAAAITQIAIETPVAIARALSAFAPPFNFVAAGLVGTAMAAQAANIAGVQLAEGGIVRARPGGIQATIGEGGQDEAVIPLDRAGEFGFGGGGQVVVNFTGPVMGNENQAREFALAIDRELLKLRRNNESVSFDSGVI